MIGSGKFTRGLVVIVVIGRRWKVYQVKPKWRSGLLGEFQASRMPDGKVSVQTRHCLLVCLPATLPLVPKFPLPKRRYYVKHLTSHCNDKKRLKIYRRSKIHVLQVCVICPACLGRAEDHPITSSYLIVRLSFFFFILVVCLNLLALYCI